MFKRSSETMTFRPVKIGFLVNPVSGMGGRVGLKGTDGADILARARELGALPQASIRARRALSSISKLHDKFEFFTVSGEMGEEDLRQMKCQPSCVLPMPSKKTGAQDTIRAAREFAENDVDLIFFAGGDGTARDILQAVGDRVPMLGIPAGVKMHSGVFAKSPEAAGQLVSQLLNSNSHCLILRKAEVMDVDEEAQRKNRMSARLYGVALVPASNPFMQNPKSASRLSEAANLTAVADELVQEMDENTVYILGPGTTTQFVSRRLGLMSTLMGVDVIHRGKILAKDVCENKLLSIAKAFPAKIIVGVVGGQGFVLGRGNQQISAEVIKHVGANNIIVFSSVEKLIDIKGHRILVDTGNSKVDEMLDGYTAVRTAPGNSVMTRIMAA